MMDNNEKQKVKRLFLCMFCSIYDIYSDVKFLYNFCKILYLIFDYPHKHYTFKYFEV